MAIRYIYSTTTPEGGTELWITDGTAAGTLLLKDIVAGIVSSSPEDFTVLDDGRVLFTADDGLNGRELWVTDGTSTGTFVLKDIYASGVDSLVTNLTPLGDGRAVFSARNATNGIELWITDGTTAGTVLLKDIVPGINSSFPASLASLGNGKVLFSASDATNGNELWVTDGTAAGTLLVKDINPGTASSSAQALVALGDGRALFTAIDAANGRELWVSDGTDAGTFLLKDIASGTTSSSPALITPLGNGSALFTAQDSTNGRELWVTNGTVAGTFLLRDIVVGSGSPNVQSLTVLSGGRAVFAANSSGVGVELWVTNGTAAGTVLLKDIFGGGSSSSPAALTVLDSGHVLFTATTAATGVELWVTDGTADGTFLLKDIVTGSATSGVQSLTPLGNGRALFVATDTANGQEVWVTDGSVAGTALLKDIHLGTGSSAPEVFNGLGDGRASFVAYDPVNGSQLWVTDGTSAGTVPIQSLTPDQGSAASSFTDLGDGRGVFVASDPTHGQELWLTDGAGAGTVLLKDINLGSNASAPGFFVAMPGGRAIFQADDGSTGRELWATDGTAAGTVRLLDIYTGNGNSNPLSAPSARLNDGRVLFVANSDNAGDSLFVTDGTATGTQLVAAVNSGLGTGPRNLTALGNGQVLFSAAGSTADGSELWVTDGTTAGTLMVKNINTSALNAGSNPTAFVALGDGRAVFRANDGISGLELWVSDGTNAGTTMVKDIQPGAITTNSFGQETSLGDGRALFTVNDGTHGTELWVTDGTNAGTFLLNDISPGTGSSSVGQVTSLGDGRALFSANSSGAGIELWITDGTVAGTMLVKNINATATTHSVPSNITPIGGGRALFTANDGMHDNELWITDGTTAGTSLVADINPGTGGGAPTYITPLGDGRFVFTATSAANGTELWVTDGTSAGTTLVSDINPGTASSNPGGPVGNSASSGITPFGAGRAIFIASDPVHGQEVWITDGTAAGTMLLKDVNNASTVIPTGFAALANSVPVGAPSAVLPAGSEDTAYVIQATDLLQGFSDLDGDTLSVDALGADHGELIDNGNSSWTFTPDANYNGPVSLTYNVIDGHGGSIAATQSFALAPVNDTPSLATPLSDRNATQGSPFAFSVDASTFADIDGDALVHTATLSNGAPLPAWLGFDPATRSFSGTPGAGDVGSLEIRVTATDSGNLSADDVFTLTVAGTNNAPTAQPNTNASDPVVEAGVIGGSVPVPGDPTAVGNVLANDVDVDAGDTLVVSAVNGSAANVGASLTGTYGSLLLSSDGSYTYTLSNADPDTDALPQDAVVQDAFTYTARDAAGSESTATLTVTISGWNDQPIAQADTNAGDPVVEAGVGVGNTPIAGDSLAVGNVLTNDYDVDAGDVISVGRVNAVTANVGQPVAGVYGTLVLGSNGAYTYTLNNSDPDTNALAQGAEAVDAFTYDLRDLAGRIFRVGLDITVSGSNDAPTGSASAALDAGSEDTPYLISKSLLLQGFSDVDAGDVLSVVNLSADNGSLVDNGNGSWTFTPAANYNGPVALSYDVIDGNGGSIAATQGFNLGSVNDAPFLVAGPESFVGDGKVVTDVANNSHDSPRSVVVQIDGKVLVAGGAGGLASVVRYNTDGTLDSSFGGGTGKMVTDYTADGNDGGSPLALLPSGKFLLAGNAGDFVVGRFNADGSLDTSFGGGDGKVTAGISGAFDSSKAIGLTADGGFVVAGFTSTAAGNNFSVARFNADGSLNTSFGGGVVSTDIFTGSNDFARAVAVQGDGKVVVGGVVFMGGLASFAIVRYNTDGSLDSSFGVGGKVTTNVVPGFASNLFDMILQPDGKILALGFADDGVTNTKIALLRYNADGSLDAGFGGGDGIVRTGFAVDYGAGTGVALQTDGKIVISAFVVSDVGTQYDFGVARYNADGSLDTGFGGGDGKVTIEPRPNGYDVSRDVAVLPDGRIVVVGEALNFILGSPLGAGDIALLRLNADGTLDTSTASVHEDAAAPDLVASGGFGFDDVDLSDTHTASAVAAAGNTLGGSVSAVVSTPVTGDAVGSVEWTYTLANSAAQHLAEGQRVVESFVVTIDDGSLGTVNKTIDVAVFGVNDAPTVANAIADQNTVEGQAFAFTVSANAFADVDAGDTLTYTAALAAGAALPSWLSFDALTRSFSGTPQAGDAGVFEVRVTATDDHGVSISDDFTLTVVGDNVLPVVATSDLAGAVTELITPLGVLTDTGTIGFSDANVTDTHAVAPTIVASPGALGTLTANVTTPISTLDGTGGVITWDYSVAAGAVEYLAVGQALTESFTITLDDGQGGAVERTIDVTITGTNDAPVIAASPAPTYAVVGAGTVLIDLYDGSGEGSAVALQPDGKLVIAAQTWNGTNLDSALLRLGIDGKVDTSFGGGDGKVITDFAVTDDGAVGVVAQPDGKIVTVGYVQGATNSDIALVRYNADGSLDTTFGSAGKARTDFGSANDTGYSIALQADGRIVVAGITNPGTGGNSAVVRYTANGVLDTTFGVGGRASIDFAGTYDEVYSVQVLSSGKILIAGRAVVGASNDFTLMRLNANGSLDLTFGGGDGKVSTDFLGSIDIARALVVQADGRIVVAGQSYNAAGASSDFGVARYTADGEVDTSFGNGTGRIRTAFAGTNDAATSVAVQADGKIVVGGWAQSFTDGTYFALARYAVDGSLDSSFGGGTGLVTTNLVGTSEWAQDLVIQPDGKIVLVGRAGNAFTNEVAIVRYNADGSLDTSFGAGPLVEGFAPSELSATGTFSFDDVDLTDAHSVTVAPVAGNPLGGALTATLAAVATGAGVGTVAWTYSVLSFRSSVEALAQGQVANESFDVTVTDSHGESVTQTVTVTVTGTNDGPIAVADEVATLRNAAIVVPVRANDIDVDSDAVLTVASVGNAVNGTVAIDAATGNPRFTPTTGFIGFGSFDYTVKDQYGMESTSSVDVTVATLIGTEGDDPALNGNSGADLILGLGGNDVIGGGGGSNIPDYIDGGAGNDIITGGTGNDVLTGGPETLLPGQTDDDIFRVGGAELNGDDILGGAGIDTLQFTAPIALGAAFVIAEVEQLDMAGFALNVNTTASVSLSSMTLVGTPAAINGNTSANTIVGTFSNDVIFGNGGDDTLSGWLGNDRLSGGAGADRLTGGPSSVVPGYTDDDTFVVAGTELSGDIIAGGFGTDMLLFTGAVTLGAGFTMTGVELLDMGGFQLNVITTAAVDLSALTKVGLSGSIVGNAGANIITGTQSDDVIVGGAGVDWLSGAGGNDRFSVIGSDLAGDIIDGGEGADQLLFGGAVTFSGPPTRGAPGTTITNVETIDMAGFALTVQGTGTLNLSAIAVLNPGTITGDTAGNHIIGSQGGDFLAGGGGTAHDTLDGRGGDDILTGGGGLDYLEGGSGNDVFRISGADLAAGEFIDGGADMDTLELTANASRSGGVTISNVEVLDMNGFALTVQGAALLDLSEMKLVDRGMLLGDGAANDITGTQDGDFINGGGGIDRIVGGGGDDEINGGVGNDILFGAFGSDTFIFNTTLNASTNVDTLGGFDAADKIALSPTLFAALLGGASSGVDPGEFLSSGTATALDADDFLLYDPTTGNLYYDADGSGVGAKVLFARLIDVTGGLDHTDFTTTPPAGP